jgi:hypothetical protein
MKTKIKNLILRFHDSNNERSSVMNTNLLDHSRYHYYGKEIRNNKGDTNHTQRGDIHTGIRQ